jgi:isocitrate lyase
VAAARRIECIRQDDGRKGPRISHVGGSNADGTPWAMPESEVIREIEAGSTKFYCDVLGQSYLVVVGTDKAGAKFLKTAIDSDSPDCLLRLPRCS